MGTESECPITCENYVFRMPSAYSSNFLLLLFITTSCGAVEAAQNVSNKWWYLIIVPATVVLGVLILMLVCCLRRRCNRPADAEFAKMLSSASSTSCSRNSAFYQVALNAEQKKYKDPPKNRDQSLTVNLCDETEPNVIGRTNEIHHVTNPVQLEDVDKIPENSETPLLESHGDRFSPTSGKHSTETEKQPESTKTELTLHYLKTSAIDFGNGGLGNDRSSDKLTVDIVNNNCTTMKSTSVNSTELRTRFASRTISATSDSDYYDLDDDEVIKSIQSEEHWNSLNTDDSLFTTEETQGPKRPLPEISEPLDIVMENEMYSSF